MGQRAPLHPNQGVWTHPRPTEGVCTAYARDLRFRETRGLEEFKGREGPDNWNWFMGDPRRLPNSNPYRMLPIPHEGRAAGSGWGELKSLARAGLGGTG